MNDSQLSAKWLQLTGLIKHKWGILTNSQETQAKGSMDVLTGKVKEEFAEKKEAAFHKLNEFLTPETDETKNKK